MNSAGPELGAPRPPAVVLEMIASWVVGASAAASPGYHAEASSGVTGKLRSAVTVPALLSDTAKAEPKVWAAVVLIESGGRRPNRVPTLPPRTQCREQPNSQAEYPTSSA